MCLAYLTFTLQSRPDEKEECLSELIAEYDDFGPWQTNEFWFLT
jgi:hypothetical protein